MAEGGKGTSRVKADLKIFPDVTTNPEAVLKYLMEDVDAWKELTLNIAVIGSSGAGKSMLINAIRGIKNVEGHPLAAPVGIEEQTMVPTSYAHPTYDQLVLWDLPGVGTKNFPKDSYLKDIEFEKYDVFLICSSSRFSENDIWLTDQCTSAEKHFYMMRTKIDIDLYNERQDRPTTFSEEKCLTKIRQKYKEELGEHCKLFLISNRHPEKWDFPAFQETLCKDIPAEKRELAIFTMVTHSTAAIEAKKEALQSRINRIAMLSALGAAIPVPWLSCAVDLTIIISEARFYLEQFGLTKEFLLERACSAGMPYDEFIASFDFKTPRSFGNSAIMVYLRIVAASELAEESVIFGGISYISTRYCLHAILNDVCEDAQMVMERIVNLKETEIEL